MHIQWVQFVNFRSYPTLSYSPDPHLNILTGPNGQGKTNLLEGIGVLMVGRSFRRARPGEMLRWQTAGAVLSGEICRADSDRLLRKDICQREDGTWAVGGAGCSWARVIPFGWQDLTIVNGGPHARRDFLDGFAGKVFPAHLAAHSRYRQILGRRNHLLQSRAGDREVEARMEPWDEQLARVGIEILGRRRRAVEALRSEVSFIYPALGGGGSVGVHYQSSLGEEPTVDGFREALGRRRREELRRGQSLVGPHRDDILIELDGRDARVFGSRGQQRLLALSLRLAEVGPVAAAVGSAPVLLLDDALSELDPRVQANVLRHVEGAGQVFLTTAEGVPGGGRVRWWDLRDGGPEEVAMESVRETA